MFQRDFIGKPLIKTKRASNVFVVMANILIYLLIFILLFFLIFYYFFTYTPIMGSSMENTIMGDQRTFLVTRGYSIERGDIVTLDAPENGQTHIIIKRVIATEGDRIIFARSGEGAYLDLYLCKAGENTFSVVYEPYIKEPMMLRNDDYTLLAYYENLSSVDLTAEYETGSYDATVQEILLNQSLLVPENCFYYLGDNRNVSKDSRMNGFGTYSALTGKVLRIVDYGSFLDDILCFLFHINNKATV